MKRKFIKIFTVLFPFLITVILWRLSTPWVNPAGVLAIIPIFYCSFIRPVSYFTFFSILFCFLIDYKFGTLFMWTIFYCMYYVVANIQTFIDLTHTNKNGIYAFMMFIGAIMLCVAFSGFGLLNIVMSGLLFLYISLMYIPVTFLISKVVKND